MIQLSELRAAGWDGIPEKTGSYWWYFPADLISKFRIAEFCDWSGLKLRKEAGMVCLYHGIANNLQERIEWHAAQGLRASALRSGFLSTFRFTVLALHGWDYRVATQPLNQFFDSLWVHWETSESRDHALVLEAQELRDYCYPLNIQGNRRPELSQYLRYLKAARKEYKRAHLVPLS